MNYRRLGSAGLKVSALSLGGWVTMGGQIGPGTTIWSPLKFGLLTDKYNDGVPDRSHAALEGYAWMKDDRTPERIDTVKRLAPVAADLGCTLAQMAPAWCLKNPNVSTVITGASRAQQVRENMQALDVVDKLTPDVMDRIEQVPGNTPAATESG